MEELVSDISHIRFLSNRKKNVYILQTGKYTGEKLHIELYLIYLTSNPLQPRAAFNFNIVK